MTTSSKIFVDGPSRSLTLNVPSQEPGKKTSFFRNPVPNSKAEAAPRHNTGCISYPVLDTVSPGFHSHKKEKAIMF